VEELSKPRQILSISLRLALRGAAAGLILLLLGGLLVFSFWSFAQWGREQLQAGVEIEGVKIRSWGLEMPHWSNLRFDSLKIGLPDKGVTVTIGPSRLEIHPRSWPQDTLPPFATLETRHLRVFLDTSVHVPPDTTPPAWPSLDLPVSLQVKLDTLDLDIGRNVRLVGISAQAHGGKRIRLAFLRASSRGVPVDASAKATADWRSSDSVSLTLGGRVWGGCCSNDTLSASATLSKQDLRRGRAALAVEFTDVAGWSDLLPALAAAPRLGRWELAAKAQSSRLDTSFSLRLKGGVQAFYPLPAGTVEVLAEAGHEGTRATVSWLGEKDFSIRVKLANPRRPSQWNGKMALDGDIEVRSWNMAVSTYSLPLDADIDVQRVDRNGAEVTARMRSGSVIRGKATFAPLGWHLDGDISPHEPWATTWLPGLAIDSGAHVIGYDSGNGTAFEIAARFPHWGQISQDSLKARLWLNTKHVLFEKLHAFDGPRHLTGNGEVSWTEWFWRFAATPYGDSNSYAEVRGKIPGDIQAQIGDFPLDFIPLAAVRQKLPFSMRLTGGFVHRADERSSFEWASGRIRSRPTEDSLTALFDFTRIDSNLQLRNLRVNFGPDHLRTTLEGHLGNGPFQLDTLNLDLDSIHLERVMRLVDPNSKAGGVLKGHFQSGPSAGLTAQARLEGGWIQKEGGGVQDLPTLLMWGMRDTLNIGGYWPLGETRIPFKASISRLFDSRRDFSFIAFPSDVLRVRANGFVDSLKRAELNFDLVGNHSLEANGLLERLSVKGQAKAWKQADGWKWSAAASSDSGARFLAPEGNTFALAFKAHATPEAISVDTASLTGRKGGAAGIRARYDLNTSKLQIKGHADRLQLGIGNNRSLFVGVADITSTEDGLLHANIANTRFRERYGEGEEMVAHVRDGQLHFQSAKDWNKLTGNIQLASARYSRSIAAPSEIFRSSGSGSSDAGGARPSNAASKPFLLNLSVSSVGDSIVLANNLARARLSFNVDVVGPTTSPLLTGFVSTSDSTSTFQYFGKVFQVEQFRLDWAGQSLPQGKYQLNGYRQIRHTCYEDAQTESSTQDQCSIVLTSTGTLAHPQMQPLEAKTCAKDANAQATLQALALGCYPQSQNGQGIQFGNALSAVAVGGMRTWMNDVINGKLKGRNDPGLAFLPDSVMFKELPRENAGIQDRMVLAVGKKLTDRFDIEAEYAHVFTARADATSTTSSSVTNTATTTNAAATDDYTLRLRFHPPFHWVEDSISRARLEERVLLQVETRQSKGWIPNKETLLKPSIRYRWEFW